MWETQITVGDRTVVDSGLVTSFEDDIIQIDISPVVGSTEDGLSFIFEFRENNQDPDIERTELPGNGIKFILYNHRSGASIGGTRPRIGPVVPVEVGILGGRRLFLNFQASGRGAQQNPVPVTEFYYTFYLGEEVNPEEIEN